MIYTRTKTKLLNNIQLKIILRFMPGGRLPSSGRGSQNQVSNNRLPPTSPPENNTNNSLVPQNLPPPEHLLRNHDNDPLPVYNLGKDDNKSTSVPPLLGTLRKSPPGPMTSRADDVIPPHKDGPILSRIFKSISSWIVTSIGSVATTKVPEGGLSMEEPATQKGAVIHVSDTTLNAILKEAQVSNLEELSFESLVPVINALLAKDNAFLTPEELSSLTNIIFLKDKSLRSVEENQLLEHEQRLMCSATDVVSTITTTITKSTDQNSSLVEELIEEVTNIPHKEDLSTPRQILIKDSLLNNNKIKTNIEIIEETLKYNDKKGLAPYLIPLMKEHQKKCKENPDNKYYTYDHKVDVHDSTQVKDLKAEAQIIFELVFITGLAKPEKHKTSVELTTIDDSKVVVGEALVTLKSTLPLLDQLIRTSAQDSELRKLSRGEQKNIAYNEIEKDFDHYNKEQEIKIQKNIADKSTEEVSINNNMPNSTKFILVVLPVKNPETCLPTSVQKHINIAGPLVSITDPADDNTLISVGYLTSQDNGNLISNTKFKAFQDATGKQTPQ